ncbi:unnamed protein product, partial [Effrenium voratum]
MAENWWEARGFRFRVPFWVPFRSPTPRLDLRRPSACFFSRLQARKSGELPERGQCPLPAAFCFRMFQAFQTSGEDLKQKIPSHEVTRSFDYFGLGVPWRACFPRGHQLGVWGCIFRWYFLSAPHHFGGPEPSSPISGCPHGALRMFCKTCHKCPHGKIKSFCKEWSLQSARISHLGVARYQSNWRS